MFQTILTVGLILIILFALVVALRLVWAARRYRYKESSTEISDELPTVSVCIPARNETHAMTTCLERILASDYERLEIIVLDDSSVDDTSVLIKSFAHEGVRFVEGSPLPPGWLGKNHALEGLLTEASGSLILYLDVDTVIRPETISRLIAEVRYRKTSFLSVMPQRQDGLRASVFLGTLRYFWPLILPSRRAGLPTSGSCIVVDRKRLITLGGFADTTLNVEPEIEIAHRFRAAGESTGYLMSTGALGVSYEKKWSSQVETSIRLLKPLFGSSLLGAAIALLLLGVTILPVIGIVVWLLEGTVLIGILALLALLSTTLASLVYYKSAWRYGWWLGALHWPYVLLQEAVLIVTSIIGYARNAITWKGRPFQALKD